MGPCLGLGGVEPGHRRFAGAVIDIPLGRENPARGSCLERHYFGIDGAEPNARHHTRFPDTARNAVHTHGEFTVFPPVVARTVPPFIDLYHFHRNPVAVFSHIVGQRTHLFGRYVRFAPVPAAPAENRLFRIPDPGDIGYPAATGLHSRAPRPYCHEYFVGRSRFTRFHEDSGHVAPDVEPHLRTLHPDIEVDVRDGIDGGERYPPARTVVKAHIVAESSPCRVVDFGFVSTGYEVVAAESAFLQQFPFGGQAPVECAPAARFGVGRGEHPIRRFSGNRHPVFRGFQQPETFQTDRVQRTVGQGGRQCESIVADPGNPVFKAVSLHRRPAVCPLHGRSERGGAFRHFDLRFSLRCDFAFGTVLEDDCRNCAAVEGDRIVSGGEKVVLPDGFIPVLVVRTGRITA